MKIMKDEVQPVDEYVRGLLEHAKEKYNLKIDLEHPTRAQRLEAAVAMKDENDGLSSMEIMKGRRCGGSDAQDFLMLKMAQLARPSPPVAFYNGFAHDYWPE